MRMCCLLLLLLLWLLCVVFHNVLLFINSVVTVAIYWLFDAQVDVSQTSVCIPIGNHFTLSSDGYGEKLHINRYELGDM